MNVLIVLNNLRPANGVAAVIMSQYDALVEQGWQVDFMEFMDIPSCYTTRILSNGGRILPVNRKHHALVQMIRILKENSYDIVHINQTNAQTVELAAAARMAPIPWEGWFILTLVTTRILNTLQKLLRGLHNQRLYASSGILHTLVYLLSNILLICVLRKGIVSLFLSTATADLAAVLVILIREKRLRVSPVSRPDRALIRKMLAFSAPLVPNQLNWWIISSSDRYLIRIFLGAAANGIYAVSCKFPAMLQILLNLFNNSWQDLSVGEEGAEKGGYYSRVFRRLYRFSFSLLWPLIPATRLYITGAMAPAYHSAAEYAAFLYLGTVFQCFSSFYGVGYLWDKNTRQASLTSIYGAVINAGVNFVLIRGLGLQAASISPFLGFAAMWAVRERQTGRDSESPYTGANLPCLR